MAFVATNKSPGVYIDEVQVPGPIAGVGTSTAAIVGPAEKGPLGVPTLVTNPIRFTETFGGYTTPMTYATHAVHGFFDNGGTSCYFVRVGTAAPASRALLDRSVGVGAPRETITVTAKEEGAAGNAITVQVQDDQIAATTAARNSANLVAGGASGGQAEVDDASGFLPGDVVFVANGGPGERATVASRDTTANTLTFEANLGASYGAGGTVRIADLDNTQRVVRLDDATGLEPGTYCRITNGVAADTLGVVQSVVGNFLTLTQPLADTYGMDGGDPAVNVQTLEFQLTITHPSAGAESFPNLAMDPRHSRYFASVVASAHVDVALADPPNPTPPVANRPAEVLVPTPLAGGADDDLSLLNANHFTAAIDALERVDEVNILCVPDRTDQTVQRHMIDHCEKLQDRFAVLDPRLDATPTPTGVGSIGEQRDQAVSQHGYAALYYPRIVIANPLAEGRLTVPPSGHVAGLFARTDEERGVHKAPANAGLRGVLDLQHILTDDEGGPLNEQGINVIRSFRSGIKVWGARTTAPTSNTQWRYVNVRRLLLFIEESLQEGTEFAVFEPNNQALWQTVKRQTTDFLTRVWRDGALFGATPEEAFRVTVDEVNNPPSLRALGELHIEVLLYPTTPAEFIVFTIIQQPGGPTVEE